MGLFDYVRCDYPLPMPEAQGLEFQTKDTPSQYMDRYRITADGQLEREDYDIEDRSDPNATELLDRFVGCMTRVNQRWALEPMTGSVEFYGSTPEERWIEFSAYFIAGVLQSITQLSPEPQTIQAEARPA